MQKGKFSVVGLALVVDGGMLGLPENTKDILSFKVQ